MAILTVTSKGQMTLPKEIRDELNIKPGDKVMLEKRHGEYVLRPRRSALELFAKFARPKGPALTVEQMDEAIAEEVWERNKPR